MVSSALVEKSMSCAEMFRRFSLSDSFKSEVLVLANTATRLQAAIRVCLSMTAMLVLFCGITAL